MLKKPKKIKQFKRLRGKTGNGQGGPRVHNELNPAADRHSDRTEQQTSTGRGTKVSALHKRNMPIQTLLRHFYGNIKQGNICRYLAKARSTNGFLRNLELRLDVVLFRTGLSSNSIYTAKQLINHGHVLVNGQKIYKPSYKVELGDFVQINSKIRPWLTPFIGLGQKEQRRVMMQLKNRSNDWEINWKLLIATLVQLPNQDRVTVFPSI
jgi:ribosomal protein S4